MSKLKFENPSKYIKKLALLAWFFYFIALLIGYLQFNYIVDIRSWVYLGLLVGILAISAIYFRRALLLLSLKNISTHVPGWVLFVVLFVVLAATPIMFSAFNPSGVSSLFLLKQIFSLVCIVGSYFLFLFAWFCIGRRVIDWFALDIQSRMGRGLASFSIGISFTMGYFYICSLLHLISIYSVIMYVVVSLLVGRKYISEGIDFLKSPIRWNLPPQVSRSSSMNTVLIMTLIIYTIFAFVFASTGRPVDTDSVKTYAYIPFLIIQNNSLVQFPFNPLNNSSFASSYLYIPFQILGPQFVLYINIILFLLIMGTIYYAGKKYGNESIALRACFLFMTMDFIFFMLTTVKTDFLLLLLVSWTTLLLLRFYEKKSYKILILAGIFFGISIAVKYNALLITSGYALFLIFGHREPVAQKIKNSFIFFGSALFAFSPWGMRSLLLFGSPLYPFFQREGSSVSSAGRLAVVAFAHELSAYTHTLRPENTILQNLYLIATNKTGYVTNKIGPLFFGLLPFVFIKGTVRASKKLLLIIVPTIVIWYFVSVSQLWYCMFLLPFLWIIIGMGWSRIRSNHVNTIVTLVIVVLLLSNIRTNQFLFVRTLYAGDYAGTYISDSNSIESYIAQQLSTANPEYLILPFGDIDTFSVKDHYLHVINNDFMLYWQPLITGHLTSHEITGSLKSNGITHIFYNKKKMTALAQGLCTATPCPTIQQSVKRLDDFRHTLPIEKETDEWILYATIPLIDKTQ